MLLSLLFSAALFALDQEILARANRRANALDDQIRGRPPKTFNPLNRRWVIGARRQHLSLRIFRSAARHADLADRVSARARSSGGWRRRPTRRRRNIAAQWTAVKGWTQEFAAGPPKWHAFRGSTLPSSPRVLQDRRYRDGADDGAPTPARGKGAGRNRRQRRAPARSTCTASSPSRSSRS